MLKEGEEPIPGYRLEAFLGRGNFGEVWRTTSPGRTSAALKFIDLRGRQGLKEFRAIQRVKEIRHANLMPITALWLLDDNGNILGDHILESFSSEPSPRSTLVAGQAPEPEAAKPRWLVVGMLLANESLEDRLASSKASGQEGIDQEELIRYMEEAAKGIDFLNTPQHNLGEGLISIQHCDIKPANIMLVGGSAVICDFGLAQALSELNIAITATGMLGSPAFMAPECVNRKPSSATDQYSLAVSYVELRTGELPFTDQSYSSVLLAHQSGDLDLSRLSPEEQEVIRKATSVSPSDRYESAQEMVAALRSAVFPDEGSKHPALNRLLAGALIVTALALIGAAGWMLFGPKREKVLEENYIIRLDPSDALVSLDGSSLSTEDGSVRFALKKDESRNVVVARAGYESKPLEVSVEDFTDFELAVSLKKVSELVSESFALVDQGKRREAEDLLRRAAAADLNLATATPIGVQINLFPNGADAAAVERGIVLPDGRVVVSNFRRMWQLELGPANQWIPRTLLDQNQAGPDAGDILDADIDRQGRYLAVAVGNDVKIYDLQRTDDGPTSILKVGGEVSHVIVSPEARWLIAAMNSDTAEVQFWRWGQFDKPAFRLKNIGDLILQLSCGDDGRNLVIGTDVQVIGIDLQQPDPTKSKKVLRQNAGLPEIQVVSVAGDRALLGDGAGGVSVYYVRDGTLLYSWNPHQPGVQRGNPVTSLQLVDGQFCLTGSGNNSACLWRYDGEQAPSAPEQTVQHNDAVVAVTTGEAGKWLITGSLDKTVRLTSRPGGPAGSMKLDLKTEGVTWLGLTPDSRWLLVAGEEGGMRVYDFWRCQLVHTIAGERRGK